MIGGECCSSFRPALNVLPLADGQHGRVCLLTGTLAGHDLQFELLPSGFTRYSCFDLQRLLRRCIFPIAIHSLASVWVYPTRLNPPEVLEQPTRLHSREPNGSRSVFFRSNPSGSCVLKGHTACECSRIGDPLGGQINEQKKASLI